MSEAVTSVAGQSVNRLASSGISGITVAGFKSIANEQSIEVRPLTILAGANSSGKTSFLQPLLLLKQTLEAPYDPGPLLLDGPNVKFTSGQQFLSRLADGRSVYNFDIGVRVEANSEVTVIFKHEPRKGFRIFQEVIVGSDSRKVGLLPGKGKDEIGTTWQVESDGVWRNVTTDFGSEFAVVRNRCFLTWIEKAKGSQVGAPVSYLRALLELLVAYIQGLIHVPGLRGNPERAYPLTAVGPLFPGTFEKYVASVIARWRSDGDEAPLRDLNRQLGSVGLATRIAAMPINEVQVELRVPRLLRTERDASNDLVNISDVGFGVSQTLPVLVALLAAKPGQAVYIEQPEIHLHPRAQVRLADVLAEAAKRGVRVIAETHSSLLLRAVQTLVAKGELSPDLVKLHWFVRNENDGSTEVRSAELDEQGAYGDWPMDFDDVELRSEGDYLDAVGFGKK